MLLCAFVAVACNAVERSPPAKKVVSAFVSEEFPRAQPLPERSLTEQKRRFRDAAVYVDGVGVGVVKVTELPPRLAVEKLQLSDGRYVDRYRIAEYITATGIDLAKVKAVYLHGGRDRVAMIDGDMLRKFSKVVRFAFTQGDRGKGRMHWPGMDGFEVNTTIDKFNAISVFVDRAPPRLDSETKDFIAENGDNLGKIPYVPEESLIKGSRIYVDGKLVGAAKRKTLPDAWLAPGADAINARFVLAKFLESLDLEAEGWRSVAIAQEDDFIAVLDGQGWADLVGKLTFSLPKKSKGQFVLRFPEDLRGADDEPLGEVRISSISFFKQFSPPKREVAAPFRHDPATEPGEGPGSGDDQGDE